MAYDTVNNPNGPAMNGFAAGIYMKDNSTQFVGYGHYPSTSPLFVTSPSSTFILLNPPGALMSGGNGTLDNTKAFYLLNHPSLTWILTNQTEMMNLPNTIKLNLGTYPYFFGRVMYNGSYRVGKVHAGNGAFGLWIQLVTNEIRISDLFEVLTCSSNLVNYLSKF